MRMRFKNYWRQDTIRSQKNHLVVTYQLLLLKILNKSPRLMLQNPKSCGRKLEQQAFVDLVFTQKHKFFIMHIFLLPPVYHETTWFAKKIFAQSKLAIKSLHYHF